MAVTVADVVGQVFASGFESCTCLHCCYTVVMLVQAMLFLHLTEVPFARYKQMALYHP
jgi:hypothetical protein